MSEKETNTYITFEEIEKFRKAGLLNETAVRNLEIRKEFERRVVLQKKKKYIIIEELAEEMNMEPGTVNSIVYRRNQR